MSTVSVCAPWELLSIYRCLHVRFKWTSIRHTKWTNEKKTSPCRSISISFSRRSEFYFAIVLLFNNISRFFSVKIFVREMYREQNIYSTHAAAACLLCCSRWCSLIFVVVVVVFFLVFLHFCVYGSTVLAFVQICEKKQTQRWLFHMHIFLL